MYYSGTSGLLLNISKADFPVEFKQSSRLAYYASLFNSVEINSSFYKLPMSKTVRNWSESVGADFRLTLKVPKLISHRNAFDFDQKDVDEFLHLLPHLDGKLGCILLQFPPSVSSDKIHQLRKFLELVSQFDRAIRVAIEFRNPSWYATETYNLAQEFNATIVVHDYNGTQINSNTSLYNFAYIRLHGNEPRYRGNYSDNELQSIAVIIKNYQHDKKEVFVYFNNTMGSAFINLQTLNKMVSL